MAIARPISLDLTDHFGRRFTEHDLVGSPALVYFGFLNCRVICPRSLAKIVDLFAILGSDAKALQAFYISVDPERDTPEAMKKHLADRFPMITGLTGSAEQVDRAKAAFRVFARRVESRDGQDGYDVPHTAFIYLLDREGRAIDHFPDVRSADQIASDIRQHRILEPQG